MFELKWNMSKINSSWQSEGSGHVINELIDLPNHWIAFQLPIDRFSTPCIGLVSIISISRHGIIVSEL